MQNGIVGVCAHNVMSHGDTNHQTVRVMIRDLAEGRRLAATDLDKKTREEGRDHVQGTAVSLRRYTNPSCVVVAPLGKTKTGEQVKILSRGLAFCVSAVQLDGEFHPVVCLWVA